MHATFLLCLEEMTGHVFCRKVGRIKKSLYINIPSKIAGMLDITKGSSLHIMVQDGKVTLSKESRDKPEPILDQKDKQGNDTNEEGNLKRGVRVGLVVMTSHTDSYES